MENKLVFYLFILNDRYFDYVCGKSEQECKSKVPLDEKGKEIIIWKEISQEEARKLNQADRSE